MMYYPSNEHSQQSQINREINYQHYIPPPPPPPPQFAAIPHSVPGNQPQLIAHCQPPKCYLAPNMIVPGQQQTENSYPHELNKESTTIPNYICQQLPQYYSNLIFPLIVSPNHDQIGNYLKEVKKKAPILPENVPILYGQENLNFPNHVQMNGRKIFNFQPQWKGPHPTNRCELFIKRIPKNINEYLFLPHFQRFGPLFEFRLMLDFNECNRGYGFIKFCYETDAQRALLVMNHFFVTDKNKLEIHRSYDKCRLFVSNIPKDISEDELERDFKEMFPSIKRIILHKRISDRYKNRGFVFLDFPSHDDALVAKKQTTPGRIRKWDRDLKIVWAKEETEIDENVMEKVTTLFVRNVDLSVNTKDLFAILTAQVQRTEIKKVSRTRELAFIEFVSKQSAETVLNKLNGFELRGYNLDMQWATPQNWNLKEKLKHKEFDAVLRMKCIANYWSVPIIIFGRIFSETNMQYVAVIIYQSNFPQVFFMEINANGINDIHDRACEVVVHIIEHFGQLPLKNFIIKVKRGHAYIAGYITNLSLVTYIKFNNINEDFLFYWNEIVDLSTTVALLTRLNETEIISMFGQSFLQPISTSIPNMGVYLFTPRIMNNNRILACILPNYFYKPPLKYELNNTQLLFSLIHVDSLTNFLLSPSTEKLVNFKDTGIGLRTCQKNLISIKLTSSDNQHNFIAQNQGTDTNTDFNNDKKYSTVSYYPSEHMLFPIWVGGKSYSTEIYDNSTVFFP